MIRALRPSLVFLDVQMPVMEVFGVLERLGSSSALAVIFVTAYDAFALRAFEVHAIDYLLKPFPRARFTRAMEHSLRRLEQANGSVGIEPGLLSLLESIRSERKAQGRIAIRSEQGVYFVRISEIDWLEAFGNYVKIHVGSQEHLLRDSLKCFEERLDPNPFLRVHRSAVGNLDSLSRLAPWVHREYSVFLPDGTKLTSSPTS